MMNLNLILINFILLAETPAGKWKEVNMKKFRVLLTFLIIFVFSLSLAAPVLAADVDPDAFWGDERDTIALGEEDPRTIAANVINVILGFLGIIAVIIILLGGFKWMTAGGNQDKVDEAKKLIMAGIVGLIIILAAFGIATFVLKALSTATTA